MFYKRGKVICDQFEHLKIFSFGGKKAKRVPSEIKKGIINHVGKIPKQGGGRGPLFRLLSLNLYRKL